MPKTLRSFLTPVRVSILITLGILLVQVWTLAPSPQNPDGAELVAMVEQGRGVLHPPGFPLQAWASLAIGKLHLGSVAIRLSMLSFLFHGLTLLLLAELLRLWGFAPVSRLVGASFYAFFPPAWTMGVEPEKYALTSFLMIGFGWLCSRVFLKKKIPMGLGAIPAMGIWMGLGFSQHLIFLLVLPFLTLVYPITRKSWKRDVRRYLPSILLVSIIGALIAALFYSSLLLLARGAVWPNWGMLQTFPDLIRHLTRQDFPFGRLSPVADPQGYSAFTLFLSDYWRAFNLCGLLPLSGIYFAFRARPGSKIRNFLLANGLFLLLGLLFLMASRLHPPELAALTFLERYSLPAMLALAVFAAFGLEKLLEYSTARLKAVFTVFAALASLLIGINNWGRSDLSYDRTLDIYRQVLGAGLEETDWFFLGRDIDIFYGAITKKGLRFPIFGNYPWALSRSIYAIEPRLKKGAQKFQDINDISKFATSHGYSVASPNRELAVMTGQPIESRGIHWVAQKNNVSVLTPRTLDTSLEVCKILQQLDYSLPAEGHYYSKILFESFRYPFYSVARYLEQSGRRYEEELARKIAFSLYEGTNPKGWISGCQDFLARFKK